MRTVYSVSSGDYSSYTVHCLFETRDLAEGYRTARLRALYDEVTTRVPYEVTEDWQRRWNEIIQRAQDIGFHAWTRENGHYDDWFVEEFQLWDVVPTVEDPTY